MDDPTIDIVCDSQAGRHARLGRTIVQRWMLTDGNWDPMRRCHRSDRKAPLESRLEWVNRVQALSLEDRMHVFADVMEHAKVTSPQGIAYTTYPEKRQPQTEQAKQWRDQDLGMRPVFTFQCQLCHAAVTVADDRLYAILNAARKAGLHHITLDTLARVRI